MKINCAFTEKVDIETLVENPRNPNKHPDKQIQLLAKIMKHQGWRSPIVVSNRSGFIVKGHGRLQAARLNDWTECPVDRQDYANEADEWADMIADNKIAELAETDMSMVFEDLPNIDLSDLDLLGIPDLEIPEVKVEPLSDEDEVSEVTESICKPGDLWILGNHRLLCGDSTNVQHVDRLMNGEKADMVFTDPPYGIDVVNANKIGGDKAFGTVGAKNGSCKRIIKANEYKPIIGDSTTKTAIDAYNLCESLGVKVMCFWGANYYASALPDLKKWIFWDKNTTGNFSDGELAWTSLEGRVQKFEHTWNGLIKQSEKRDKRVHPTQKPIALAEWCFNELDKNGKSVIDLFGGSGSTLIACEKTNRRCYMSELDPHYVSVIIERWKKYTNQEAFLVEDSSGKLKEPVPYAKLNLHRKAST